MITVFFQGRALVPYSILYYILFAFILFNKIRHQNLWIPLYWIIEQSTIFKNRIKLKSLKKKIEILCHFQLFESKVFTFTWNYLYKDVRLHLLLIFYFSVPQYILWEIGSCNSQFFLMSISMKVQSCFYLTAVCSVEGYRSHQPLRTTSNEVISSRGWTLKHVKTIFTFRK